MFPITTTEEWCNSLMPKPAKSEAEMWIEINAKISGFTTKPLFPLNLK